MNYEEAQALFSKENCIYKIVQDIDMEGNTLTVPDGSVLDFQGGSIKNGSVTFAGSCRILGYGMLLKIYENNLSTEADYYDNVEFPPYHVDPDSSFSDPDGSINRPFNCVNEAAAYSTNVLIKRGTFIKTVREMEYLIANKSIYNTVIYATHSISLGAYGVGSNPIIDGGGTFSSYSISDYADNVATINTVGTVISFYTGETLTITEDNKSICNFGIMCDESRFPSGNFFYWVNESQVTKSRSIAISSDYSYFKVYNTSGTVYLSGVSAGIYGIYLTASNCHVKDMTIQNVGRHGITFSLSRVSVENCAFYNIGGSIQTFDYNETGVITQFGNAMQLYSSGSVSTEYCIFKNNTVNNVYDTGITYQTGSTGRISKCSIIGNRIYNAYMGIELFHNNISSGNDEILVYGNTIVNSNNTRSEWSEYQRGNPDSMRICTAAFRLGSNLCKYVVIDGNLVIGCKCLFNGYADTLEEISERHPISFRNNIILMEVGSYLYSKMTETGSSEYDEDDFYDSPITIGTRYALSRLENTLNGISYFRNNRLCCLNQSFLSGATDNRPFSSSGLDESNGYMYFNTELNKAEWWNGSEWITWEDADSTGLNYSVLSLETQTDTLTVRLTADGGKYYMASENGDELNITDNTEFTLDEVMSALGTDYSQIDSLKNMRIEITEDSQLTVINNSITLIYTSDGFTISTDTLDITCNISENTAAVSLKL